MSKKELLRENQKLKARLDEMHKVYLGLKLYSLENYVLPALSEIAIWIPNTKRELGLLTKPEADEMIEEGLKIERTLKDLYLK